MRIVFFPELISDRLRSDGECLLRALGIAYSRSLIVRSHEKCLYSEMQDTGKPNDQLIEIFQDVHFCMPKKSLLDSLKVTGVTASAFGNRHETQSQKNSDWLVVSNGSCVTRMNGRLLSKLFDRSDWDVLFLNVSQDLVGYREKPIKGEMNALVGFRRYYEDGMTRKPLSKHWPHHIMIRPDCLSRGLLKKERFGSLETLIEESQTQGFKIAAYDMAGCVSDLMHENGLLETITGELGDSELTSHKNRPCRQAR